MGLKSRTWLVPTFLHMFHLGQDRKSQPLPNPKARGYKRAHTAKEVPDLVSAPIVLSLVK